MLWMHHLCNIYILQRQCYHDCIEWLTWYYWSAITTYILHKNVWFVQASIKYSLYRNNVLLHDISTLSVLTLWITFRKKMQACFHMFVQRKYIICQCMDKTWFNWSECVLMSSFACAANISKWIFSSNSFLSNVK